ncbi:MAG: hypothetical protein JW874_00645 [Spirochaetales bacterium]|nr:hypothetical protein [Spirochaetales bacterium]
MLTDDVFAGLIKAASMAPSSDNMQPWEFRKKNNLVEVYCVKSRLLKIDVLNMFSWISIGAAIQNIIIQAACAGLHATVDYNHSAETRQPAAVIRFTQGGMCGDLADWIGPRTTNRSKYNSSPLNTIVISALTQAVKGINAGIHWTNSVSDLERVAAVDAVFSSILLDHKPLFDGLFDTLRFTRREIETAGCGMDIKSLDMPYAFAFIARRLKRVRINRIISRLGIGRIVAHILSSRLCTSGVLFLLSTERRDPAAFMEAGRAMEQLWLAAAAEGLSVHPYGTVPQYLAMAQIKPETFLPRHIDRIESNRNSFFSVFPNAEKEYPAIMLRMGRADRDSVRTTVRFKPGQIIRR